MKEKNTGVLRLVLRVLQGMLIGVGAVLPGISGGVLCVVFGIYKPVMELLSSPVKKFKTHVPRLLPVIVGAALGFLGVAKVLAFFLEKYPNQSVCLFVGLIGGMLPSLFREAGEQGHTRGSWVSLVAAFAVVLALLLSLNVLSVSIAPSFGWYLFCGFCMALSIIAPGMSFSTLLMPLGLYTPLVDGIGNLDFGVLVPRALGPWSPLCAWPRPSTRCSPTSTAAPSTPLWALSLRPLWSSSPSGASPKVWARRWQTSSAWWWAWWLPWRWISSTRACPKRLNRPFS